MLCIISRCNPSERSRATCQKGRSRLRVSPILLGGRDHEQAWPVRRKCIRKCIQKLVFSKAGVQDFGIDSLLSKQPLWILKGQWKTVQRSECGFETKKQFLSFDLFSSGSADATGFLNVVYFCIFKGSEMGSATYLNQINFLILLAK